MADLGRRLRTWLDRRNRSGATTAGLLLRELPLKLARKGSGVLLQSINRGLVTPLNDRSYGDRIREAFSRSGPSPHLLVAVPQILHYIVPCLLLATRHVPVILVSNGLRAWEERCLQERFPGLPSIRLTAAGGSLLPHGVVMDILLRHAESNFSLLDPDLFVFDPTVFAELRPGEDEMAAGAFGFTNRAAGLTFPTTHLLSLNVPVVKRLMSRHGIRPTIYKRTPRHLREPLAALGLGDHNFVKEYLSFYDPMNLLMAVALHEGYRLRVLSRTEDELFHVGGVSYLEENAFLDYFNLRMLELPWSRPFAEAYRRRLTGTLSPEQARARLVAQRALQAVDRIDRTVARIAEGAAQSPSTSRSS